MLKRSAVAVAALLLVVVLVVAVNTWRAGARLRAVAPLAPAAVDREAAARRLAGALRLRTIASADDAAANADEFLAFHEYLRVQFPQAHRVLRRETIGGLSLLYVWPGRDDSAAPVLLLAHQDVVPVAPGTEKDWSVDPFGGVVRDGYVWGRGALDDKSNLLAQLEAVEQLAAEGFAPRRTILVAFGADEEVLGLRGARAIAAQLAARGIRPAFVLDEGLPVTRGVLPGVDQPLAILGVAEKGYASLALRASAAPGHSAAPGPDSAVTILAAAVTRVAGRPMPARLRGLARDTLAALAPEMSGLRRVVLSNLWLFAPAVRAQMEGTPAAAMLRTTIAFTRIRAGEKENVIPGNAEAVANCRLLPGDSIADVEHHVADAIHDHRVEIRVLPGAREPSAVSPHDTADYRMVETAIREVYPGTVVAPGLMIAGTDSFHYRELSANLFRFSPFRGTPLDLSRLHGTDERIAVDDYADAIRFYRRVITRAAGQEVSRP